MYVNVNDSINFLDYHILCFTQGQPEAALDIKKCLQVIY